MPRRQNRPASRRRRGSEAAARRLRPCCRRSSTSAPSFDTRAGDTSRKRPCIANAQACAALGPAPPRRSRQPRRGAARTALTAAHARPRACERPSERAHRQRTSLRVAHQLGAARSRGLSLRYAAARRREYTSARRRADADPRAARRRSAHGRRQAAEPTPRHTLCANYAHTCAARPRRAGVWVGAAQRQRRCAADARSWHLRVSARISRPF